MELIIRMPGAVGEIVLPISPDGREVGFTVPGFTHLQVTLLPDCVEDDFDRNGDCDGRVREVVVIKSGAYGKLDGETTFLCAAHRQMAGARRAIRVLA